MVAENSMQQTGRAQFHTPLFRGFTLKMALFFLESNYLPPLGNLGPAPISGPLFARPISGSLAPPFASPSAGAAGGNYSDPGAAVSAVMKYLGGTPGLDPSQFYDPSKPPQGSVNTIAPWGVPFDIPTSSPLDRLSASRRRLADILARASVQPDIDAAREDQAGNNAALNYLDDLSPVQRRFTPFTPKALPVREQPVMPDRVRPRVDPSIGIATGLLGLLAPKAAPQFTLATMRGAVDEAERNYGDRIARFKNAVEQVNQRYGDEVAQTEQDNSVNLANLRGSEAADYANDVSNRSDALARLPYISRGASLVAKLGTDTQPGSLSRRLDSALAASGAQSDVNDLESEINTGLARNKSMQDAHDREVAQRTNTVKAIAPLLNTSIRTKSDADQFAQRLKFDQQKAQREAAYNRARVGVEQSRAETERLRAGADVLDKGLMVDPKTGKLMHDPNAADYSDAKATAGEVQAAARSHTATQRFTAQTVARLSKQYREANKGASEAAVWNFVSNSMDYKFARKMEEDAGGRLAALKASLPMAAPNPSVAAPGIASLAAGVPRGNGAVLDKQTAIKLLQQAGGDKNKARALARQLGYQIGAR